MPETSPANTKDALLAAAAELIRELGFDAMTTAAVARRAGVAEGTIYRHFSSKDALAEAVFADIWRRFNAHFESRLPPRERPVERLEAFFPQTIASLDAIMPQYGSLAQQEHLYYASKHQALHGRLPDGTREYVGLLEDAIALAQAAGKVKPAVDPRVAAHFLFFGGSQAMEFFGDPHALDPCCPRLPAPIFAQLMELMKRALYGDNE
jgi:AcrR family transcriptional regulator